MGSHPFRNSKYTWGSNFLGSFRLVHDTLSSSSTPKITIIDIVINNNNIDNNPPANFPDLDHAFLKRNPVPGTDLVPEAVAVAECSTLNRRIGRSDQDTN